MAQGRYDCSLASMMARLVPTGSVSGSATDLARNLPVAIAASMR